MKRVRAAFRRASVARTSPHISIVLIATLVAVVPATAQEETPSDPTRLEGVPTRVEAQIVDVTQVRADRDVFDATDEPSPVRYRLTTPKERPWSFAEVRPQQRRVTPVDAFASSPTARAGVLPLLPGRVRYDAFLSRRVKGTHAALFVDADSQNGEYTRQRGSATAINLRGTLTANAGPDTFRGLVEWRNRSANWQVYDPSAEPDIQLAAKNARFRRLSATWDRHPVNPTKTSLTWDVDALDYHLEHESAPVRADSVGDVTAHGRIAFTRELSPRYADIRLEYDRLETPRKRAFSAVALTVTLEDRYVPFESGVVDYKLGVRVYGDPQRGSRAYLPSDSGRTTRYAFPVRLGFSSVQQPWMFRSAVEYSVSRFPESEYVEREWVVVNPFLRSERAWTTTTSLERTRRKTTFGVEVSYRYVNGLPVWIETVDGARSAPADASATAWMPVEALAHILEQRLYIVSAVSRRGRVTGDVRLEQVAGNPRDESDLDTVSLVTLAKWEQLPYRPKVRVALGYGWIAPRWSVDASGKWFGRRYRDPVSKATLNPYGLLGATISRDVAGAITIYATGEVAVGGRRVFASALTSELYQVAQHIFGIGIRTKL
jgi:hypothetical protein